MSGYQSFRRRNRLTRNFEFRRILKKGASYRDGIFILTILRKEKGPNRLGISISSSRLPEATKRNRAKRLIRETFRLHKQDLKNGPYDIVIVLRRSSDITLNHCFFASRILKLLERAKAI